MNIDVKKSLKYQKKRVIKNISNAEYNAHTSVLYKKWNIPNDDLFKIKICKFMYLFINCILPEYLINIFTPNFGAQKYFPHVIIPEGQILLQH